MDNKNKVISKINQSKAFIDLIQQMGYEGLSIENENFNNMLDAIKNIMEDAKMLINSENGPSLTCEKIENPEQSTH